MWLLRTEIRQEGMEFNHLWGHIMRSLKTSLALLGSGRNGWRTIIRCLLFATAKKMKQMFTGESEMLRLKTIITPLYESLSLNKNGSR